MPGVKLCVFVSGCLGVIWSVIWWFFSHERPGTHPTISDAERIYIETSIGENTSIVDKVSTVCHLTLASRGIHVSRLTSSNVGDVRKWYHNTRGRVFIYLFVCLFVCSFVCLLIRLFIYLFVCFFMCLFVLLFILLLLDLLFIYLFIYLFISIMITVERYILFIYSFVYLFIYLCVRLFRYLFS